MKTIAEILVLSADFLQKHHIDRAKREAEEILAQVLGFKRIDLFLHFEMPLTEQQLQQCRIALQKRIQHLPFAYIFGFVEFSGIKVHVTPDVLIPRPETECLVEAIAKEPLEGSLVDLCCGSGAIGLALKAKFPQLDVTLVDICPKALAVAQENAHKLNLQVECVQSDLLANINKKIDYLVCNPPYVTTQDYENLSKEVKQEPYHALVAGPSGYECYQRLAEELETKNVKHVWFEIGTGMGDWLEKFFTHRAWVCQVTRDFAGHQRYLSLRR